MSRSFKGWRGNRMHNNAYYTASRKNALDRPKGMFGPKDKAGVDRRNERLQKQRLKEAQESEKEQTEE